jgi:predicted lactoylglutathione lyase
MTKEIWLNLPVKDLKKSQEFFKKIGFDVKDERPGGEMSAMMIGSKQVVVMLCAEKTFTAFAQVGINDTKTSAQILISFDAESPAEIDDIAKRAEEAGANVFAKPSEIQGWMYGCAFADPDGHRWNALYMDMSKMPK